MFEVPHMFCFVVYMYVTRLFTYFELKMWLKLCINRVLVTNNTKNGRRLLPCSDERILHKEDLMRAFLTFYFYLFLFSFRPLFPGKSDIDQLHKVIK